MQQTLPDVFRWDGELGRLQYFSRSFYRMLLLLPLTAAYAALWVLAGNDLSAQLFEGRFFTTIVLILFIPLDLRRMNDIGLKYWWLVAAEALNLLPTAAESTTTSLYSSIHMLAVNLPYAVFYLYLLLKPGRTYREHRRSQQSQ